MFKTILIDPFSETITPLELAEPSLKQIYAALRIHIVEQAHIQDRHVLLVDEEGLFKKGQNFFRYAGFHQPLAGLALVAKRIDTPDGEEWGDPDLTLKHFQDNIKWLGEAPF